MHTVATALTRQMAERSQPKGMGLAQAEQHAAAAGLAPGEVKALAKATSFTQISSDLLDYSEKHQSDTALARYFQSNVELGASDNLLDVGCSTGGLILRGLSDRGASMTGLDLSCVSMSAGRTAWRVSELPNMPTWVAGDMLSMPFQDRAFTRVVSSVTLAHVPIRAALAEIRRVMANRGQFICTVEGDGFINEIWDRSPRSLRAKLGIGQMWLGHKAQEHGMEWRGLPIIGRLAGYTAYTPEYIQTVFAEARLVVQEIAVLAEYCGRPRLIGIRCEKRD